MAFFSKPPAKKKPEPFKADVRPRVASARELAQKLPKDLHWSEELSLTFRLPRPTAAPSQSDAKREGHSKTKATP